MVRLPIRAGIWPEGSSPAAAVKMEVEDRLEEQEEHHGSAAKRSRHSPPRQQVWSASAQVIPSSLPYNPLDEPSPLGLRLKKSPSLLELIQMRLSQKGTSTNLWDTSGGGFESIKKKDPKPTAFLGTADKMKASNFPASLLRIGSWECASKYEGDLVAKCYYAKHKLVWEVLDGGLKSKIEIQWSDIAALKANCPENGPGTLDIVLSRLPLFFRETNPQPRKHTLWQATSDFTGGQSSIHRRHFLQCPQGLLNKHYEKLIQCDPRLNCLSQNPSIILDSPYFEPRCSAFEDQDESKCRSFDNPSRDYQPAFVKLQESSSPRHVASTRKCPETQQDARENDRMMRDAPSPSSDNGSTEVEDSKDLPLSWDQIRVPGLRPSMSMRDLANHMGKAASHAVLGKDKLEELTHYLLSDNQGSSASDELSLMSRVNSLCCLLQKDGAAPAPPPNLETSNARRVCSDQKPHREETDEVCSASGLPPPAMAISRKDSFGDLLMHLPQIASIPQLSQFFVNISEDTENQAW